MSDTDLPAVELPRGRRVPEHALFERTSPHGGPGGQHANRSSTRVELRVLVAALPLTAVEDALLRERLARRMAADGTVGVVAGSSRHQLRNRQDARRRLTELLARALEVEPPRVPSRISRGARDRRRAAREREAAKRRDRSWRPDANDE
jgi:ribosome-associated protein